ncbi:MAG: hypothetical protein BV459_01875 [Thermoplasmata archaeon M11B2D]|nr:MAG: hypothetical protein BV459_01875 [Thermoplasmata archaeon M11B2D]
MSDYEERFAMCEVYLDQARNDGEEINNIGDVRVRSFIHPDSMNVRVWEVLQFSMPVKGSGKPYWKTMEPPRNGRFAYEPFCNEAEAMAFAETLKRKYP